MRVKLKQIMNNKFIPLVLVSIILVGVASLFLINNSNQNEQVTTQPQPTAQPTAINEQQNEQPQQNEDVVNYTITSGEAQYVAQKRFLQRADEEIVGTTTSVTGDGFLNTQTNEFSLNATIDLTNLQTDSGNRDADVISFFTPSTAVITINNQSIQSQLGTEPTTEQVEAVLSINGIEQQVTFNVQNIVQNDNSITAEGSANILMSDFNVNPPSLLNVYTVDDEVEIKFTVEGQITN